jgi:hypothetical protein
VSAIESQSRRAKVLLAIGALVGIALAASGILEPASPELASTTIAQVGQDRIDKREYLDYLELLARDKRNPLTGEDQRHVLDRMIDEKLLLARGLEMGLPQSSPKVRKTIVQQVMQSALAEVSAQKVDDNELPQFYQDNIAYFSTPPRTQLRRLVFSARGQSSAQQLAEQAWQALQQGQGFDAVGDRYASEDLLPLPSTPLPDHKLLQYLGPSLTASARQLHAGSFSRPIVVGQNRVILQVLYKRAMEPKPFAEVRDRVAVEYQRRRREEAMAAYLQELRRQSDVVIDEAFLDTIAPSVDANAN